MYRNDSQSKSATRSGRSPKPGLSHHHRLAANSQTSSNTNVKASGKPVQDSEQPPVAEDTLDPDDDKRWSAPWNLGYREFSEAAGDWIALAENAL